MKKSKSKVEIFNAATKGDKKAIRQVIKMYTPMVHMWANKYGHMCSPNVYDDLVQEGLLGISQAIQTFDHSRRGPSGDPIYPTTWIWWKTRAAVQKAMRSYGGLNGILSLDVPLSDSLNDAALTYREQPSMEPHISETLNMVIDDICGPEVWPRAQIIRDRFGLKDGKRMTQVKVAAKYGLSRQSVCAHISRFARDVKKKYPELKENLR